MTLSRIFRLISITCFTALLFNAGTSSKAADDVPPGFLPVPLTEALTWTDADALCKMNKGYLPTIAQLQELAKNTGDGSFAAFGMAPVLYWTRESKLGKYYGVSMESGDTALFETDSALPVMCGYGAGAPLQAATPLPGFATGVAPATMHFTDAERWCARRGHKLPTANDLKDIAKGSGDSSFTTNQWPEGMYWTREAFEGGHTLVHLGNGQSMGFPDQAKNWTTCTD